MMKKAFAWIMVCCLLLGMTACGSEKNNGGSADSSVLLQEEESGEELPVFEYSGDKKYFPEICEYLLEDAEKNLEQGDVTIPAITFIDMDETDTNDIKVWGIFEQYAYNLEEKNLVMCSGAKTPGLFHLKKLEEGAEVVKWDQREDGANADESLKAMCASKTGVYELFKQNENATEQNRTYFVRMYVEDNGLDIDTYQDPGQDPVKLFKEDTEAEKKAAEEEAKAEAEKAEAEAQAKAAEAAAAAVDPAVAEYESALGHFVSEDGKGATMDILRGGEGLYTVNIGIIRLVGLNGVGKYEGDTMEFTAAIDVDESKNVAGTVQGKGDDLVMTINESDWKYLEPGTTFHFKKEY